MDNNLGAELCYLAQLPRTEQYNITLAYIDFFGGGQRLLSRPFIHSQSTTTTTTTIVAMNSENNSHDHNIQYYSPVPVFFDWSINFNPYPGDVIRIGGLRMDGSSIRVGEATKIETDGDGWKRIKRIIGNLVRDWIDEDVKSGLDTVKQSARVHLKEEKFKESLLVGLPFDLKYEIISFIPTYSKQEKIKMLERNVRNTCEHLEMSEDEFYEKHCDPGYNVRLIEKRLNPDCLKALDNDFMRFVKMRVINREFAIRMKSNIMKLDLLNVYSDDLGKRKFVRLCIEQARQDYLNDSSTNPLQILYHFPKSMTLNISSFLEHKSVAGAPIMNHLGIFKPVFSFTFNPPEENPIPLLWKTDFMSKNRKQLKLYRPTFILGELRQLRGLFSRKLEMYCLFFDDRVSQLIVDEFIQSNESFIITLHKREYCKRLQMINKDSNKLPIEIDLIELEQYHPLMLSNPLHDDCFFYLDLIQIKRMVDSIFKPHHFLFETKDGPVFPVPQKQQTFYPPYIKVYMDHLCEKYQYEELDLNPSGTLPTSSDKLLTQKMLIDRLRYKLEIGFDDFVFSQAVELIYNNPELRSYFFRPYLTFSMGYQLMTNILGTDSIEYMEETELFYQDEDGSTVLHCLDYLNIEVLKGKLLKYPQLLNICDNEGRLPSEIPGISGLQEFLINFIEENDIILERKFLLPYERQSKKQKRIDSYFHL